MSIRVAHVITGLGDGGAEASLFRLCSSSSHLSHVVISLSGPGKYGSLLEKVGVPVHCLGLSPRRLSPAALFELWSVLRKSDADVVQTWLYHADLIGGITARLAGIRAVSWGIHSSRLAAGSSSAATILIARLCARLSAAVPARIVCCSERAARENQAIGYSAQKFRVIPNGYNLEVFRPEPGERARVRAALGVDEATPLLGMVGRFDPYKDHQNLIRALGILRRKGTDFTCALVGDGMEASNSKLVEWLRSEDLGAAVVLLGRRDDIPAIMNALDLHVLSSSAEAFPNVLNEAMACGTPCVTTDVGDAALIVGDTGWVVPPADSVMLAAAMETAVHCRADAAAWSRRQQSCRRRIAHSFSIETMVRAYVDLWTELSLAG